MDHFNIDWTPVIAAVGGLISGLGAFAISWLRSKYLNKKPPITSADLLLGVYEVFDELSSHCSHMKSDRGLILYTSNGGGIPKAASIVNTTVLYEVVQNHSLEPVRSTFQHIALDEAYAHMLREVILNGYVFGRTEDLKPGFLKYQYAKEGVKWFYIWQILVTEDRYYYGSMIWLNEKDVPEFDDLHSTTQITTSLISNTLVKSLEVEKNINQ